MSVEQNLTCFTCAHWHAKPKTAATLGQPQRGDCRFGPPNVTSIPAGPQGQVAQFSAYPDLPANFAACSQHEARLEIAT